MSRFLRAPTLRRTVTSATHGLLGACAVAAVVLVRPGAASVPECDRDALLPLTIELGDYGLQRSTADLDLLYGGACDAGYAAVCEPGRWRADGVLDPSAAVAWFGALCDGGDLVACVAAGWAAKRGGAGEGGRVLEPADLFRRACEEGLTDGCKELGRTLKARGDLDGAIAAFETALVRLDEEHGEGHAEGAAVLNQLALIHKSRGDYEAALPFARRTFQISLAARGAAHLATAIAASNLALLYKELGHYEQALPLLEGALRAFEIGRGPDHPDTARAATNLATLHMARGDLDLALPLAEQASSILEAHAEQPARDRIAALNNLALVHRGLGQIDAALPILERALAILDDAGDSRPGDRATVLNSLAALHGDRGELAEAEALYRQVLEGWRAALGDGHPDVAIARSNLADVLAERGDLDGAADQLEQALAIRQASLGDGHPSLALALNNLAVVESDRGHPERARELHGQALAIREETLGPEHPSLAVSLTNLALLETAGGELVDALVHHRRARGIEDAHLARDLSLGTTAERRAYLDTVAAQSRGTISFHLQQVPGDEEAARLALRTVVRRKGLLVDAEADTARRLRESLDGDAVPIFDEIRSLQTRRETLSREGPSSEPERDSWSATLASFSAQVEGLQRELARRSAAYRSESAPPELEDVAARLPGDAVLVEFVRYAPLVLEESGAARWDEDRYAVYLLWPDGEVLGRDLGPARGIDRDVTALVRSLAVGGDLGDLDRGLFDALLGPVVDRLAGVDHLLIAPDDLLHLVPWDVLGDSGGERVLDRWLVTGLTSARDLLREGSPSPVERVLVVAGVDFGKPGRPPPEQGACGGPWSPLPGSADEGDAIHGLWPGATVLGGRDATETALRGAGSPGILHVASHGCYEGAAAGGDGGRGARVWAASPGADEPPPRGPVAGAMLRSAVVLAGANEAPRGDDNGYLTAAEWATLDLGQTQLVILSACETGVGEVRSGEGVLGLRRGLVLAGARTQVLSLWKVDDQATAVLMERFHERLRDGEPRGEALRRAKDELRRDPEWADPRHWAAFTLSGDWRPLPLPVDDRPPPGP